MARYDVVIVGGGVVGATIALNLSARSRCGLRVALVDAAHQRKPSRVRTSALANGPLVLLRDLLGAAIDHHLTPIRKMEISTDQWRGPAPPDLAFVSNDELAAVVVHDDLESSLSAAARAAGVELIVGEAVNFEATEAAANLYLSNGAMLQASLIVAADGDRSRLRKAAGIQSIERDYKRTALVATLCHNEPNDGIALQIFYKPGPFALLPLGKNKSSMVWVETTDMAQELFALPPQEMRLRIQERSKSRFGDVVSLEEGPYLFPLKSSHARTFASKRLLLAGDAIRRVHPLAGQGLNLGLRDAAALSRCILDYSSVGIEPGALDVAQAYASLRHADSVLSAAFLEMFFDLFDASTPGLGLARSATLRIADQFPTLKNYLVTEAAGLRGDHSFL